MRLLYVSKASRVATHRDKLAALRRAVDVTLVVPHKWGSQRDEGVTPRDPPTVALPAFCHGHNHLHLYRGLGAVIDLFRPDVVHADEEPYSAVTAQVAGLCRRRGVPFLFFAWQNLDRRLPPPFGALRRSVFRCAAGGIAGTERAAAVLRRAGFTGTLAIIPQMGVDPKRFRPDPEARGRVRSRLGVASEVVVLGYVGRLVREKGVELLLAAVAGIPQVVVVLAGAGPDEARLRECATAHGVGSRVRWVGPLPSTSVPELLAALDLLVLPSLTTRTWSEQFGRILIEAMACGVAVVGSDSGEIPSVIGKAGMVVAEGAVAPLRAALVQLVADRTLRMRLGEQGRARVLDHYTQDAVVEETLAFYGRLLCRASRGPTLCASSSS